MGSRRQDLRPDLRVGTAERSEVADALSQHFAEGRLDATEFNERTELAMNAKTRADLSTLLTDLPGHNASASAPPVRRHRPRLFIAVVFLVLLGAMAIQFAAAPHVPWLLITVVALWVLWRRHGGRNRWHDLPPAPPGF